MAKLSEIDESKLEEWLAGRNDPRLREMVAKKPGNILYRMRSSGHRCTIYSYSPEDNTVTVAVTGQFNLVTFGRQVFGIPLDELEECELPAEGEILGELLTRHEDILAHIDRVRRGEEGIDEVTLLTFMAARGVTPENTSVEQLREMLAKSAHKVTEPSPVQSTDPTASLATPSLPVEVVDVEDLSQYENREGRRKWHVLLGSKVERLFRNAESDVLCFVITTAKGEQREIFYRADGDCCSESWFHHGTGIDALVGGTVNSVSEVTFNEDEGFGDNKQGCTTVYFIKMETDKGHVDIEMRNTSNGYYGGSVERIAPQYAGKESVTIEIKGDF